MTSTHKEMSSGSPAGLTCHTKLHMQQGTNRKSRLQKSGPITAAESSVAMAQLALLGMGLQLPQNFQLDAELGQKLLLQLLHLSLI